MAEFWWMEDSLRLMTLDELRDLGVTVYQAPKLPKRAKLVNLTSGVLLDLSQEGSHPVEGSYAKYEEISVLATRFGVEFSEVNHTLEPALQEAGESS